MNTIQLKTYLHTLIDRIDDITVLNALRVLLSKKAEEADWWDELSPEEKASIEQGIREADRGQLYPHNEVMQRVRAKCGRR